MVVVGGGITGLATAWFLRDQARVTVLEADGRLGGKIRTSSLGGVPVEEGPDTFLARVPHAWALAAALDVEVVEPATGKAFVWPGAGCAGSPRDRCSVSRSSYGRCCGRGRSRRPRSPGPASTWCCPGGGRA